MDEAPVSQRMGGTIRPMLTPKSVGSESGFLGTMALEAGEYVAEHYHPYSDEYLFVADGSVVVRIDGHEQRLDRNDAVLVPKYASHRIENRDVETALVVFQICPLAPSPELGHVDVEPPPFPELAPPTVGG
jgi:putative monooxygenase